MHVGADDFPANEDKIEELCNDYEELLDEFASAIPQAKIVMSSVLPRAGNDKEGINTQIDFFNLKMNELAQRGGNKLYICDNTVHFNSEQGVVSLLYSDAETSGINITRDGKNRLASAMTDTIKMIYF